MSKFPMSPNPTGWFRVAAPEDVRAGEIHSVRYFNRDLVLYRRQDGAVVCFDAHCPHLGAHFGHGGEIDERDNMICPFHLWKFDTDGLCADIPYGNGKVPTRARLRKYPVVEKNGSVAVFWDESATDLDESVPTWDLGDIDDYDDTTAWTERLWRTWKVKTHVQEICENAPDAMHQRALHGAVDWPIGTGEEPHGPVFSGGWTGSYSLGEGLPVDKADQQATYEVHGLGFIHIDFEFDYAGMKIARQLQMCVTPIDDEYVQATMSTRGRRLADPDSDRALNEMIADYTWAGFIEDIPIWENKVYRSLPAHASGDTLSAAAVFVGEDRDIVRFRKWARQFYAEDASALPS